MKNLLALLIFLMSSPAWGTWSLVHANACNTSCVASSATCAVTVSSTTAGDLLVGTMFKDVNLTMSNMTGGTFVHCPNCAGGSSGTGWSDGGYILAATGGTTSLTMTVSGTTGSNQWIACVQEYSSSLGTAVADNSAAASDTTCTTCAAPALTLTGTNDLLVQIVACTNTCQTSATAGFVGASPYTNPATFPNGDGIGGALNVASYTAPNWSQNTSGAVRVFAMAFKEFTASAARGRAVIF